MHITLTSSSPGAVPAIAELGSSAPAYAPLAVEVSAPAVPEGPGIPEASDGMAPEGAPDASGGPPDPVSDPELEAADAAS